MKSLETQLNQVEGDLRRLNIQRLKINDEAITYEEEHYQPSIRLKGELSKVEKGIREHEIEILELQDAIIRKNQEQIARAKKAEEDYRRNFGEFEERHPDGTGMW